MFLYLSLNTNVIGVLEHVTSGNGGYLWNQLIKYYERDTVTNRHAVRDDMHAQRLKADEDISAYVG